MRTRLCWKGNVPHIFSAAVKISLMERHVTKMMDAATIALVFAATIQIPIAAGPLEPANQGRSQQVEPALTMKDLFMLPALLHSFWFQPQLWRFPLW